MVICLVVGKPSGVCKSHAAQAFKAQNPAFCFFYCHKTCCRQLCNEQVRLACHMHGMYNNSKTHAASNAQELGIKVDSQLRGLISMLSEQLAVCEYRLETLATAQSCGAHSSRSDTLHRSEKHAAADQVLDQIRLPTPLSPLRDSKGCAPDADSIETAAIEDPAGPKCSQAHSTSSSPAEDLSPTAAKPSSVQSNQSAGAPACQHAVVAHGPVPRQAPPEHSEAASCTEQCRNNATDRPQQHQHQAASGHLNQHHFQANAAVYLTGMVAVLREGLDQLRAMLI